MVLLRLPSTACALALSLLAAPAFGAARSVAPTPEPAPPNLPAAVRPAAKEVHRADLVVPKADQDHSAFRYDSEVFGWSKDFSEVGSVSMEVVRGPQGRHRGEAFMLVYRIGSWLPKHNIICHNITHVDLPDNPVPMERAEDYLWVIEHSYLHMWPNRPMRRPKRGFMRVTPLTAFLPEDLKLPTPPPEARPALPADAPALARASHEERTSEAPAAPAPLLREAPVSGAPEARCRPWVGFVLDWHGKRRLQPFVPLDMGARCGVLRRGEAARTYWGRSDVAASMVHVNFAANEDNEESARFVASAAWRLGRSPRLELRRVPLDLPRRRQLTRTVREMGGHLRMQTPAGPVAPVRVRGPRAWLGWGGMLAEAVQLPVARYVVDESQPDVVVFEPAGPGDAGAPTVWEDGGGSAGEADGPTPAESPTPTPRASSPRVPPTEPHENELPGAEELQGADVPEPPSEPAPTPMPEDAPPKPTAPKAKRGRYIEGWKP